GDVAIFRELALAWPPEGKRVVIRGMQAEKCLKKVLFPVGRPAASRKRDLFSQKIDTRYLGGQHDLILSGQAQTLLVARAVQREAPTQLVNQIRQLLPGLVADSAHPVNANQGVGEQFSHRSEERRVGNERRAGD